MTPKTAKPITRDFRRQEARRQRDEASGTLWQRVVRHIHPQVLLIWTGFYLAAAAILLAGRESMPWRLMQQVDRDITARVDFAFVDQLETAEARQKAHAAAPLIYVSNDAPLQAIQGRLTELLEIAHAAGENETAFFDEATRRKWKVNESTWQALREYTADDTREAAWHALITRLVERLEGEPIADQDGGQRQPGHKSQLRRSGEPPVEIPTSAIQIASYEGVQKVAQQSAAAVFPEELRPLVSSLIVRSLSGGPEDKPIFVPLWRFDASATAEAQRLAEESIQPVIRERKAGDTLVSAAAGKQLSPNELNLLKSEHEAFLKARRTDPVLRQQRLRFQAGLSSIVLLVTLGLASYTVLYEHRAFQKPGRILGLAALLLSMLGAARLIEIAEWPYDLPVEFSVGLVTVGAALMSIAFGQRFAFGGGGALSILITLASRGDLELFLILLSAAGLTSFLLKEVRTRSKVVGVGAMAGLAAMLTTIAVNFVEGEELTSVLIRAVCAGLAALVAGFVVQGILPQFERLFGVATSMTLLEWCDASRPLLRLLAQNAPGTYSHSLMLSDMAEKAAEAIGARGLLARVGALYHDIGKANKPDYFVENQEARINRHDKLSPTMSMLIISGHVKDGIEMAKAYGLPRILHQFIAEHHGTTVVRYFHRAACEAEVTARTKRFCDRDVPESEFRYPGPKPSSKETAILMLCDGCEGAVRALPEPTPGRIESVVHQVVMDRLNDGQFDNCDVTLRELKLVERSLVKSLAAIHHGRIKYPDKAPAAAKNGAENLNGDAASRSPSMAGDDQTVESSPETPGSSAGGSSRRSTEVMRQA